jgi:hypothetical protein
MSSPNEPFDDEKPPVAVVGKLPGGDTNYAPPSTASARVGRLPPSAKEPGMSPNRNVTMPSIKSR